MKIARQIALVGACVLLATAALSRQAGSSGSPSADLLAKLTAAKKPAVGKPLVIDGSQVCGSQGSTSDPKMQALNSNKNRTDEPNSTDYVTIAWGDLSNLPVDKVDDLQGAPVSVVGYLSRKINVETGAPGESTNCNLLQPNEVDWHMYLTNAPAQQIKDAVIVETTPRVRPNHKWTTDMLSPYINKPIQVRISGWLIYDFQHTSVIGKERATVWEVHPITKIEVRNANGSWTDIEK